MRVGAAGGGGACSGRSGVTACEGLVGAGSRGGWSGPGLFVSAKSLEVGGQRGAKDGKELTYRPTSTPTPSNTPAAVSLAASSFSYSSRDSPSKTPHPMADPNIPFGPPARTNPSAAALFPPLSQPLTSHRQRSARQEPRDDSIVRILLLPVPLDRAIERREQSTPDSKVASDDWCARLDRTDGSE